MTFTLTALRDDVEADLRDATNVQWSTAQVDRAIEQALDRYQRIKPRVASATVTSVDARTITLSAAATDGLGTTEFAALIAVTAVEYPTAQWPPTYVRFDVYGPTLTLHVDAVPVAADVTIYYDATHTLDGSGGTIVDADREILAVGAAAYALLQRANEASNNLNVQTDYDARLSRLSALYMAKFDKSLDELRAAKPLGNRQLYRPDNPARPNKSIVRGPNG